MSATSEYEPVARQVYGPASTSKNVYDDVLEPKLADMNIPNCRAPILRAASHEQEPDSTNPESTRSTDMPIETLSGIVRIEDGTVDSMGRVSYPIIQDDDYLENHTTKHFDIIQAPMNTTIVQNVSKIQQNYAINMDAANIATIHNVTQEVPAGQTLWLPTILTTSTATVADKDDVSQYILATDTYDTQPRRASIAEATYPARHKSKVQIISNISIPNKCSTYAQQYGPNSKDMQMYSQSNHLYKLGPTIPHKTTHSVVCNKSKTQSATVINNNASRNIAYAHAITKPAKINNGANLNAMAAAATSGNAHCHIVSRVVSGTNKTAHPKKAVNSVKSKNSTSSQKGGQSRSIKIIQQAGSLPKSDSKAWSSNNASPYKNHGVIESGSKVIQKVGSPTPKSAPFQKVSKEGLLLQSSVGPVLITTAPLNFNSSKSQYVQAGLTPNLHYVQTYGNAEQTTSQISANQQLTAQILQSLSQPKLMMPILPAHRHENTIEHKPPHQRKIMFGDSPSHTSAEMMEDTVALDHNDTVDGGDAIMKTDIAESIDDSKRHSVRALASVMLDHTYSQPLQKMPPTTNSASLLHPIVPPAAPQPTMISTPSTPPSAPVTAHAVSTPTSVLVSPIHQPPAEASRRSPPPAPSVDDDAASVTSEDAEGRRHDSDTETAPEGEDEGKTRCICDFSHDDGYMICCDRCGEWQHVDCMGVDRDNIPDVYMCELCQPRPVDVARARHIQMRKRDELSALQDTAAAAPVGDGDDGRRHRLLTVTTYCDTAANPGRGSPPHKRGPKKNKKLDLLRKGSKRKLVEKRVKRKKDGMLTRKYANNTTALSHWQDSYEQAMTNHYSPELRAKIVRYSAKSGGASNMSSAITAHLCTNVPHAGGKILIATKDLRENTPIIELRGKYMLSQQHKPQPPSSRGSAQKPGPYVFFYRLPKDNTQICIDTRTYGNEARFVRRSCKPNAELQHCIVKGALHVYLSTISAVQADTEITVGHEADGGKQLCACGNPKHCKVNGMTSLVTRKTCDYPLREKRLRNRGSGSQSPSSVSPPLKRELPKRITPKRELTPLPVVKLEKMSPIKQEETVLSPIKIPVVALKFEDVKKEERVKKEEPMEVDVKKEDTTPDEEPDVCLAEIRKEELLKLKMKQEALKDEVEEKVKEEEIIEPRAITPATEEDEDYEEEEKCKETTRDENERVTRNSVIAKSACHDRSSRSSRNTVVNQDSLDDKTDDSQDKITSTKEKDKKKMTREERKMEAIMKAFERMERAQQKKQEVKDKQKRRESDPVQPSPDKDDEDDGHSKRRKRRKGRTRTTSQTWRRRIDSVDSDAISGDEHNTHVRRTSLDTQHTRQQHNNEDLGLSPACLLVEAAVGSVESTFKLPKTKKTIANEWVVGQSPERIPSPYRSPYRTNLVSAPSLESLVHVASTIIGDLSADEGTNTRDRNVDKPQQHSAKKRWLRQAISEESDSPNAGESPPNEMITPLKKRRVARESLSYDQTPILPCQEAASPKLDDSPVKQDIRLPTRHNKTRRDSESIYCGRDRSRSESGHGSDDQCQIDAANDVLNANVKGPHDSENIRRIIGVPLPGDSEEPVIVKVQDLNTINNNVGESASSESYNAKPVPMEIDTSTPNAEIIDLTDASNDKDPRSADTSGNSSPQRNEMDDIQKKIHSFHTENIMILKSRNKKPPKEKRKKVNLNFDLNMVDDQISIQLRTNEMNGDVVGEPIRWPAPENIPLPPAEPIRWPTPENIPLPAEEPIQWPEPENIPMPMDSAPEPIPEAIPFPIDTYARSNSTSPESDTAIRSTRPFHKFRKQLSKHGRRHRKKSLEDSPDDIVNYVPPSIDSIPMPTDGNMSSPDVMYVSPTASPKKCNEPIVLEDELEKPVKVEPEPSPPPPPPIDFEPEIKTEPIIKMEPEFVPALPLAPRPLKIEPELYMEMERDTFTNAKTPSPQPDVIETQLEALMTPEPKNNSIDNKVKAVEMNKVEAEIETNKTITEPETVPEIETVELQNNLEEVKEDKVPILAENVKNVPNVEPSIEERAESEKPLTIETPTVISEVLSSILPKSVLHIEKPDETTVVPFSPRGSSTGLFSGIFNNITQNDKPSQVNHTIPDVSLNNESLNHSSILDKRVFQSTEDELRSVQEILSRVNNMGSSNLLSGVLSTSPLATMPARPRPVDPRLNPPPTDKPKPVRRKLSISEYRKRHKCSTDVDVPPKKDSDSDQVSHRTTDSEDDLDTRIHRSLVDTQPKGVFDARATCAERVREKLSCRLRREFGLALPDDDLVDNSGPRQEASTSPSAR